jgi:hypothetical protein
MARGRLLHPDGLLQCLTDGSPLLVREGERRFPFHDRLGITARFRPTEKGSNDDAVAPIVQQSDGETLLPRRVLEGIKANKPDPLKATLKEKAQLRQALI